jgi:hypothetical protein
LFIKFISAFFLEKKKMYGQADFLGVVLDFSRWVLDTTKWGVYPLHSYGRSAPGEYPYWASREASVALMKIQYKVTLLERESNP